MDIIILLSIIAVAVILIIAAVLLIPEISADHICFTNTTSVKSHFSTANLTSFTNITHPGYCLSA